MRRYTLNIGSNEFVIDVQETDFDQFEVTVGGAAYLVSLLEDQAIGISADPSAPATPRAVMTAAAPRAATPAAAPSAPRVQPAGAAGKGALKAPMPGVILEVNVKPGDVVKRGEQVAILDAMKMHNVIGAPRDGTIAEVCVEAGQTISHGDAIVTFVEG